MKLLILNGPNLNLLGTRDPDTYGHESLATLETKLTTAFTGVSFEFFQSNSEGALITRLHQAHADKVDGVVFNPGAYTHNSVALHDAVEAIAPPVIEVHISNIYAREAFRHRSMLAPVCAGQISGLGMRGYLLAAAFLIHPG